MSMCPVLRPVWLISFSSGRRSISARGKGERAWVKDDGFGLFQAFGETIRILFGIVIDEDLVSLEFWIAPKRAERVLIVIDHGDVHRYPFAGR